jgi:hypothetical protein
VLAVLRFTVAKAGDKDYIKARDLVASRIVGSSLEGQQLLERMEAAGKLTCERHHPAHGGHTELRYREPA